MEERENASALREHLALALLEPVWRRNTDLDPNEAIRVAYEELSTTRAQRQSS